MKLYPSLTNRLQHQHEAITEILRNLDEGSLTKEIIPGKWSIHDNIAHLARYQPVFLDRIKLMLASSKPPAFEAYVAENDPEFPSWQQRQTADLTGQLIKDRNTIFNLLAAMPEDDLSRSGVHKKYGMLNIIEWTEFFVLHEAHHIFTLFKLSHENKSLTA